MNRSFLLRLFPLVAARGMLRPYPGWRLGIGEAESNTLLRLRRRLWNHLKAPCIINWLDGLRVYLYPGNEISRAMFFTGYYEPNEFCLLDRILARDMTFVDIGANIGLYTLFASKKVGKEGIVLAIEPSSREFHRLRGNAELNGLTNVRLFQLAVSNSSTEAELLLATEEKSGHNTLGAFGYDSVTRQGNERVRVERLDDIIQKEGLQRIDVIKMDIEGAEYFALQGAKDTLTQFRPIILLELSDRTLQHQRCNSEDVWEFLTQTGYRVYTFDRSTGLPVTAERKQYFDAENVIAVHSTYSGNAFWLY